MAVAILLSGWLLCGFSAPRLVSSADVPSFAVSQADLTGISSTRIAGISAESAIVLSVDADRVLYERNPDERLPEASTTKLMTALLTLEGARLDDTVTIDASAAGEPGSRMGLVTGEQLTVRELLYGLLLPSGNDAAIALAEHDAGSVPAFVAAMNRRAEELGLRNTHYMNPDGLDAPRHYSSARDLANLALFGLQSQSLLDRIVKTKSIELAATTGHPPFDLTNLNELLGSYAGADGVKTGTTSEAGQVLVAAATRDGHRVLSVVMHSDDRYADSTKLLNHAFTDFVWFKPYDSEAAGVQVDSGREALLPAWEAPHVSAFFDTATNQVTYSLLGSPLLTVPFQSLGG